jgi:hypothetical protein
MEISEKIVDAIIPLFSDGKVPDRAKVGEIFAQKQAEVAQELTESHFDGMWSEWEDFIEMKRKEQGFEQGADYRHLAGRWFQEYTISRLADMSASMTALMASITAKEKVDNLFAANPKPKSRIITR